MTMPMHSGNSFKSAPRSSRQRQPIAAGGAQTRLSIIKRFGIGALKVLAASGALTAIVALKAAIYFWRFHS
jgi:hypothetical protein